MNFHQFKLLFKKPAARDALVFILYLVFYFCLFLPRLKGAGQFWDAAFPYFQDQIKNYFWPQSSTWISIRSATLNYSSDYFFRLLVSTLSFLKPEYLLYYIYVLVFSLGSYAIYLTTKENKYYSLSFLAGLGVFISPASFHNYIAGYLGYIVSFVIFLYLVYFLIYKFKPNFSYYLLLATILSFVGVSLHFFIFSGFVLIIYFLINPKHLKVRYLPLFLIPLLINLPWLVNVLTGGTPLGSLSASAVKQSFNANLLTTFQRIFNFSFSHATLIEKYYSSSELIFFLVFVSFSIYLSIEKVVTKKRMFVFLNFIFFTFLGTGIFHSYQIWPISILYPMFRESGHFATIITFFILILIFESKKISISYLRYIYTFLLIIFILSNSFHFVKSSQALDFAEIRNGFSEFHAFSTQSSSKDLFHVIEYPFFNQYGFRNVYTYENNSFRLNNTGHESFIKYSGLMYVDNEIAPYKFNYTPQYKLLKTLDLKNLQLLNVQYIFDLSNIYDSYYYKYVPAETYDNDLSLIKNNPNFFSILLANNPGQIEKVSAHIYKILNIQPYITSFAKLYQLGSTTQELPEFLSGSVEDRYYANFQNGNNAALPATKVDELFAKVDGSRIATETLKLNSDNLNTIYALSGKDVFVKQNGKKIIIYSEANSSVILNGKEVPINSENTLIKTITIDPLKNYYIRLENSTVPLLEGQGVDLGSSSLTKHIVLYEASGNVLENGSFEDGTWKTNVEDCSAYDEAAVIGMSLSVDEKTAGEKSLQLEASRHVACTSQVAKVVGGKDYVLSFDYQSPNAADASYYVGYNDEGKSAIDKHISISSNKWKRYQETITIPMGASQAALFFYARPYWERSQSIINRYDNVTLEKLDLVQDITLSPSDMIVKKLLNEDLPNTVFKYDSKREDPVNVVPNGSFENGGWQERVGDCGNYDSNPDIAMKVDSATSTEGKQSIYLSAKRHTACTSLSIPVNEGRRYSLSFDYQSPTKSRASFYVDFDGSSDVVMRKELPIETPSWQTYTTDIAIPSGAKMMRLYVYAMESDKSAENVNRYDNFRLAELPDVDERYYVASDPLLNTQKPSSIQFEVINTTNKKVHITHAVAPFYLVMSESYHPKWRLELNNSLSIGWMPVPSVDAIDESNHFELNNALNGWYIDPVELCGTKGSLKDGCTMNEDGSYNMELIIEFTPQRWFYVGLIISGTTLLSCLLYLGYDFVKKNRKRKRIKNTP